MDQQKILIVQLGRIGDLILMTPMFEAIKRDNPRHEIHLLCGRRNSPFAATLPNIAKVHTYEKSLLRIVRLVRALRAEQYQCWIDPKDHYSGESALFASWVRAPFRIGFNRENRRPVFTHSVVNVHSHVGRHFIDRSLDALVPFLGTTDVPRRPDLPLSEASESRLATFLSDCGVTGYSLVNVSAGGRSRHWPLDRWISVILAFPERAFLVNAEPADRTVVDQILARCPNAHHFQTTSFADVISLVRHAELLVSPDTSLIHVAAAFDIPTVGLYRKAQSSPTTWTPLSRQHHILSGAARDSIADIGIDAVTEAVASLTPGQVPFSVPGR